MPEDRRLKVRAGETFWLNFYGNDENRLTNAMKEASKAFSIGESGGRAAGFDKRNNRI